MKRITSLLLSVFLFLGLCACGQRAPTWQEQYDLGIRYLDDGNYKEAIIAFTAAIEINPKQAPAYVGRGDAYVLSGETVESLTAAQADYEKAVELDKTLVEAYLGLADAYIRQGNYEKALEILQQGHENTGRNQKLSDAIESVENDSANNRDVYPIVERRDNEDGSCWIIEQYEDGRWVERCEYPDGTYHLQEYSLDMNKVVREESTRNPEKELEISEYIYSPGSKEVIVNHCDAYVDVSGIRYTMSSEDSSVFYSGGGNHRGMDTWTIRIAEVSHNGEDVGEKEFVFDQDGNPIENVR